MSRVMKQPRKDVLREQLVAAADEKMRLLADIEALRGQRDMLLKNWRACAAARMLDRMTLSARLRRWWARVRA